MEKTDKIRAAIGRYINVLFLTNSISTERLLKEDCICVEYVYMQIQRAKDYIISNAGVAASELTVEAIISAFTKDLGCSRNEFISALNEYTGNLPEKAWQYITVEKNISPEELIAYILQKHFR